MRVLLAWILSLLLLGSGLPAAWMPSALASASSRSVFSPAKSSALGLIAEIQTRQQFEDLKQKAFAASQSGQFEAADGYWSELLEAFPDSAPLWSNRGNIRVSQNRLEAAIADYDKAVEFAPNSADPYINRGAALEGLGRWQEAIADYNQALQFEPDSAALYNNRGNAKGGQGDWEGAIADYQEAAKLMPNFALARVNTALALYQVGEVEPSIQRLRGLVRKYPRFADVRAALTAMLWATGRRGEAESNWYAVMGLDTRYKDIDWVRQIRRWPPAVADALDQFLTLS